MIYVTRHGQTNWNLEKRVMGKSDITLNEIGITQAKVIRDFLENITIDKIISSPLLRAKQTAQIINEKKQVEIFYDNRLSERDFGEFEGLTIKDFDFYSFWNYYQNNHYKSAENIQKFFIRVYECLDDIISENKEKDILIVTHGGISIPIDCYFNESIPNGSFIDKNIVLENCQVKAYQKVQRKF